MAQAAARAKAGRLPPECNRWARSLPGRMQSPVSCVHAWLAWVPSTAVHRRQHICFPVFLRVLFIRNLPFNISADEMYGESDLHGCVVCLSQSAACDTDYHPVPSLSPHRYIWQVRSDPPSAPVSIRGWQDDGVCGLHAALRSTLTVTTVPVVTISIYVTRFPVAVAVKSPCMWLHDLHGCALHLPTCGLGVSAGGHPRRLAGLRTSSMMTSTMLRQVAARICIVWGGVPYVHFWWPMGRIPSD